MAPVVRRTPNVRQRQLGMALRTLREEAGLSAEEAGERTGCSQSKITRIEQARIGVGRGDLYLMLETYGVIERERKEAFWALALAGRQRGWWTEYKDVIAATLGDYIAFESEATTINAWSLGTIHGLLQTEAYARAIFTSAVARSPDEIDLLVAARMRRQARLTGSLEFWAILDESVLSRPIGGPTVLRAQLDHLLALPPAVTLQVVPVGTLWHAGLNCAFTLMSFSEYPAVAFVDAVEVDQFVDAPESVARYTLTFNRLRAAGANPTESLGMIADARDRIKQ
jgi:transcriptional regulator with XRE-family HTH domain